MYATYTPLLAEGKTAQLDLGLAGSAACRITGFAGPQVLLEVRDSLFAEGDVQPGYLLLDDGRGHIQAVRGNASRLSPGTAVMHLTDTFSGQRRLFSRAPLVLPVVVHGTGGAGQWDSFTRDVSAGGVALARQAAWDGSEALGVTIAIDEATRFDAETVVQRISPDALGLRFTSIEPEHRALLAELAVAFHRR
jgi:hypothetical protein